MSERLRPIRPTDPPPPAPPPIRSVRITLRCQDAIPVTTLTVDTPDVAQQTIPGNWIPASGFSIFDLPGDWPAPFGANLVGTADGYQELRARFTLAKFEDIPPAAEPVSPPLLIQTVDYTEAATPLDYTFVLTVPPMQALHVDHKWFKTSDGQRWSQYGCTDFRLLERFLAGEDIDPVLSERAAIGFNQVRVLLMCDWMFHLYPQEHPNYFPQLAVFMDRLQVHGLRAELVVFADATRVMPNVPLAERGTEF